MSDASKPHIVFGVDPGHGGRNLGAEANNRDGKKILEKDITWAIGQIVKAKMPEVYLTRSGDDETGEFGERSKRMKQCGANIVVSLHCDSTPWADWAHGTHAYYRKHDPYGQKLARFAVDNTPEQLNPGRGGVICAHDNPHTREDDWKKRSQKVVSCYRPASVVLIEFGYMSNASDLEYLVSREGKEACAELVVATLSHYRKLTTGE